MQQVKKAIFENDYPSFALYIDALCSKLFLKNKIELEDCERLKGLLDNCYIVLAAKHFIVNTADLGSITEQQIEIDYTLLDQIEDIYIDFQDGKDFWPICVKICKANYLMSTRAHKDMTVYNVSILVYEDKRDVIGTVHSFSFTKDLLNRYLVDKNSYICSYACAQCKQSNSLKVGISEGLTVFTDFCLVSDKKLSQNGCVLLNQAITPKSVLDVLGYILKMYSNRQNLDRKNGRYRELYHKHKVHIAHTEIDTNKESVLDLSQYYKYEQIKKPWQGGHHISPIEHNRKGHTRVYRNQDGSVRKVVQVKATTVNKGGRKGVYKL